MKRLKHEKTRWLSLGERICSKRGFKRLTAQALVDQLKTVSEIDYRQSYITRYERGDMSIPIDFFVALAKLGWDIPSLFERLEVYPPLDYYALGLEMSALKIRFTKSTHPDPFLSGYEKE